MHLAHKNLFRGLGSLTHLAIENSIRMFSALSHVTQHSKSGVEVPKFLTEPMTVLRGSRRVLLPSRDKVAFTTRAMSRIFDRPTLKGSLIPLPHDLDLEKKIHLPTSTVSSPLKELDFNPDLSHLIPLRNQGKLVWLLILELSTPAPLSPEEARLLALFKTLCTLVLKQTLLVKELEQRHAELESLLEMTRKINEEPEPMKALSAILEHALKRTRATSGSLIFVDSLRKKLRILTQMGLPEAIEKSLILDIGQGITGWVAREKNYFLWVMCARILAMFVPKRRCAPSWQFPSSTAARLWVS